MTAPLQPQRPTIPGTPIRKLKRFVTDTLFPIAGGPFQINRSYGFSPLGPENQAMTMAPLRPRQGDTAVVFFKDPRDDVAAHETGHIIDHRNLAPLVYADVEARRRPHLGPVRSQDQYFRASRDEYVAEAFARAVESGRRRQFADSLKVDREFPGTIELIRWLQTRPPFVRDGTTKPREGDERLERSVPDADSRVRLFMNLLAAASKRRKLEAVEAR